MNYKTFVKLLMEYNYIIYPIFIFSIIFLAFAIRLWLGRPKINSLKKQLLKKNNHPVKSEAEDL